MSLNYDTAQIANYKELDGQELYNICCIGMVIDMGEMTADNINEWKIRYTMFNLATNGFDINENLKGFEKFIGLKINVVTKTRAQFKKRAIKMLEESAERFVK